MENRHIMPTCPVCENALPQELPPFCDRCGWDLKSDLTLVPTLGGIDDATIAEYRERIMVARQVWNRQKVLERNLNEMGKRLAETEQKAKAKDGQRQKSEHQTSARIKELEQKLKEMERQLAEANVKRKAEKKPPESSSQKAKETSAKTEKKPKERKQHQRDTPMPVSKKEARKEFGVGDWERPKEFVKNDYHDNGDGTVTDRATGLTWQKSGSDWLDYEEAKQYVDKLNIERFAGYTDWRLPTVRELLSLMEPRMQGWRFWKDRLYINTIFDDYQWSCWSANLNMSGGPWNVYFLYGYIIQVNLDIRSYVRAVRPSPFDLIAGAKVLDDQKTLIQQKLLNHKVLVIKLGKSKVPMRFVYIPPGEFIMGSPEDEPGRMAYEKQHKVILTEGFFMQTTPVTQAQWEAVMGYNPSHFDECGSYFPVDYVTWWDAMMGYISSHFDAMMEYISSHFDECGSDCPVENVSWEDAQTFIEKLNEGGGDYEYRLPTEAQWEYACRAGTTTRYYTGDSEADLKRAGWYGENSGSKTHPVGQKAPNSFGLYEMHGNVHEWCSDWFGDYPSGPVTDPTGPESGARRVGRGGSWGSPAGYCRSACRARHSPGHRYRSLGFRVLAVQGPGSQVQVKARRPTGSLQELTTIAGYHVSHVNQTNHNSKNASATCLGKQRIRKEDQPCPPVRYVKRHYPKRSRHFATNAAGT